MKRASGILMPITALPSKYGIGTLGKEARNFVDFLVRCKQTYWQILPIGPTSYGDSPYQSFSSYAGNPYLIDLDDLHKDGYLNLSEYTKEYWGDNPEKVDYGNLYQVRFKVLKKATDRLNEKKPDEYQKFLNDESFWLNDYALFMSIKMSLGGVGLKDWPKELRMRYPEAIKDAESRLSDDIMFWKAVQFFFFKQWAKLKQYANDNGILMIGDIPIYVALDSVEVWTEPHQFQLNKKGDPKDVAGCPPDGFSPDGQLWGNPLYAWNNMKKDHYDWWCRRIKQQSRFYDLIRIDHFRGFAGYYSIPAKDKTARNGRWRKGPGIDFFREVEQRIGKINIIAEDLGFLTPDVIEMVKESGYPGMKVLLFAFDSRDTGSGYLPHMYNNKCIAYTGTHDNETVIGWIKSADKAGVRMATEYLHLTKEEGYNWGMIRGVMESVADTAIIPLQDYLGLDDSARFNIPSTLGGNWMWRCSSKQLSKALSKKIAHITELYGRADTSNN